MGDGQTGVMNEATEDFACVRCGREVVAERRNYVTFERMHWACFHYEFEHEGDPDVRCFDPSCPANALIETDLMAIDRREEIVEVLDGLVAEWAEGNPADWENWTIPQYLDAMAAWLRVAENAYLHGGQPLPANGWEWFKDALQVAARYE